ncbi:DUF1097 domain-containing protein [Bradyrhizobium sp. JYMT SZCCT0428]|nr:DUF1097 domain-containing protein [Bradyrhizobium sp. JYMT SZCCT0428]
MIVRSKVGSADTLAYRATRQASRLSHPSHLVFTSTPALPLSIAVLGGIWAFLALGPLSGFVLVWPGFIGWGASSTAAPTTMHSLRRSSAMPMVRWSHVSLC